MPEETPRQYKKRIDEKWEGNAKNKDKLIEKIETYELLDEGFKEKTKQEILANFQKNQKAEQGNETYTKIMSELEMVDKKYKELEELKERLKKLYDERSQTEKEMIGSKLDMKDITTLKIQMAGVRKIEEKLTNLKSEIEELEKEIANREQEIKEMEETYGEKVDSAVLSENNIKSINEQPIHSTDITKRKSATLEEYHKQTIKELWNKDKVRGEIFKLLDDGTGIDDELKERIKKEISDRFWVYYDEKQGSLKMKSARHLKNRLKDRNKEYEEIKAMPEGEEKIEKLKKYERLEKAYKKKTRREGELSQISHEDITDLEDVGIIGGKPCFKAKDGNGDWCVYRGGRKCGYSYKEIGEVQEIGGKPCFKAKDGNGYWCVYRGHENCASYSYTKIGKIRDIGGKPAFKARDDCSVDEIKGSKVIRTRFTIKGFFSY